MPGADGSASLSLMSELNLFREKITGLIDSMNQVRERTDEKSVARAVSLIEKCTGKVVVFGVGKSGDIGRKIASTMTSLEIPAVFIHPSDAMHGDLGRVHANDVCFLISHSGETLELIQLLPHLKNRKTPIISITGKLTSTLATQSDAVLDDCAEKEICPIGLAPMNSTLTALAIGDALTAIVAEKRKLTKEQFAKNHPSGQLGKRLTLKVRDVMIAARPEFLVPKNLPFIDVLSQISKGGCGAVCVQDGNKDAKILGIITDGDVRRAAQAGAKIVELTAQQMMTANPTVALDESLAMEALDLMENRSSQIAVLPVLAQNKSFKGFLRLHDLVRAGI